MGAWIPAAIGAGASILGTAANVYAGNTAARKQRQSAKDANAMNYKIFQEGMAFNAQQAQKSMDFSSLEAKKLRDWQEGMSNTSYQRAMKDLKKAGINPMLAYMQGGAGTPSGGSGTGAAGSAGSAKMESVERDAAQTEKEGIERAVNTAMGIKALRKDLELKDWQITVADQQAAKLNSETGVQLTEIQRRKEETKRLKLENSVLEHSITEKSSSAKEIQKLRSQQAKINERLKYLDAILERSPSWFSKKRGEIAR